ncbi:hypothetical protein ACL02T_24650 [Pseudonocardia sp. RS010]|uniref:hypothetical protein n=1 Tax=Pseudonocardia sp. RS010 TaxID=3385979 RepID=UPI0039A020D2
MRALLSSRRLLTGLAVAVLTLGLAACGGGSSSTECGLDGCTVTFPRNGAAAVSVLGVEARLVGVENDVAELRVAGQQVRVPVGGQTEAGGFTVGVERVTDSEVVVRVRP